MNPLQQETRQLQDQDEHWNVTSRLKTSILFFPQQYTCNPELDSIANGFDSKFSLSVLAHPLLHFLFNAFMLAQQPLLEFKQTMARNQQSDLTFARILSFPKRKICLITRYFTIYLPTRKIGFIIKLSKPRNSQTQDSGTTSTKHGHRTREQLVQNTFYGAALSTTNSAFSLSGHSTRFACPSLISGLLLELVFTLYLLVIWFSIYFISFCVFLHATIGFFLNYFLELSIYLIYSPYLISVSCSFHSVFLPPFLSNDSEGCACIFG